MSRLSEAQYSDKYPMSIVSPVKSFNNSTATCPSIFRLSKSSIICRSLISLSVIVVLKQMPYNVCVYAGCGFRSHDKSPWANEITKTKLQTNTQARSLHKHAVAGSGASTPNLFCNQTVHRYGLSFTVPLTFTTSCHDSSTCLPAVTRSPVSPVTLIRHRHMCQKSPTCRRSLLCPVY